MTHTQFKLVQRRDTLVNWINNNPILLDGEIGFIKDTKYSRTYNKMVIGDGKHSFNELPKIKLNFDEPTICSHSTNSSSIVANKNLFPWIEDNYFIF